MDKFYYSKLSVKPNRSIPKKFFVVKSILRSYCIEIRSLKSSRVRQILVLRKVYCILFFLQNHENHPCWRTCYEWKKNFNSKIYSISRISFRTQNVALITRKNTDLNYYYFKLILFPPPAISLSLLWAVPQQRNDLPLPFLSDHSERGMEDYIHPILFRFKANRGSRTPVGKERVEKRVLMTFRRRNTWDRQGWMMADGRERSPRSTEKTTYSSEEYFFQVPPLRGGNAIPEQVYCSHRRKFHNLQLMGRAWLSQRHPGLRYVARAHISRMPQNAFSPLSEDTN